MEELLRLKVEKLNQKQVTEFQPCIRYLLRLKKTKATKRVQD